MKAKCVIEIAFPDRASAESALKAISHEGDIGNRSIVRMGCSGERLELRIEAQDIVALRAAANALLRGVQAIEGVEEKEV